MCTVHNLAFSLWVTYYVCLDVWTTMLTHLSGWIVLPTVPIMGCVIMMMDHVTVMPAGLGSCATKRRAPQIVPGMENVICKQPSVSVITYILVSLTPLQNAFSPQHKAYYIACSIFTLWVHA